MDQAFAALPMVAVFAHAIPRDRWRDQEHRSRPEVAKYYRSLARRMWREAQALQLKSAKGAARTDVEDRESATPVLRELDERIAS
jgi:hypothetical protein